MYLQVTVCVSVDTHFLCIFVSLQARTYAGVHLLPKSFSVCITLLLEACACWFVCIFVCVLMSSLWGSLCLWQPHSRKAACQITYESGLKQNWIHNLWIIKLITPLWRSLNSETQQQWPLFHCHCWEENWFLSITSGKVLHISKSFEGRKMCHVWNFLDGKHLIYWGCWRAGNYLLCGRNTLYFIRWNWWNMHNEFSCEKVFQRADKEYRKYSRKIVLLTQHSRFVSNLLYS